MKLELEQSQKFFEEENSNLKKELERLNNHKNSLAVQLESRYLKKSPPLESDSVSR